MELDCHLLFWEWALLSGLSACTFGLIRFYIRTYSKVTAYAPPPVCEEKKPVSVVLSGKNQYESLKKNLTFWLEQKYPCFEVVVVYENTDEDVSALLEDFSRRYGKLSLVNANQSINFFDEQKFSLSIGAKSARYEYVIMTHPKFRPASEHCIDLIQSAFGKDTRIVIGHAVFEEKKQRICSFPLFRILENTLQYLGFALRGKAFIGRQCLIAYRKSFFLEHQGYSDNYALDCGDFDRFGKRVSGPHPVNVQIAAGSEVKYTDMLTPAQMIRQERHFRTSLKASQGNPKREIRVFHILNNLYWLFFTGGIVYFFLKDYPQIGPDIPLWAIIFGTVLLAKYVCQALVMQKAGNKLGYGLFWFLLPFYDFLSLSLQFTLPLGRKRGRS